MFSLRRWKQREGNKLSRESRKGYRRANFKFATVVYPHRDASHMTLTPESFAFCFRRRRKNDCVRLERRENKNEEFFGSFFGIATQFIPTTRQWRIFLAAPDDCESGLFALTPRDYFMKLHQFFSYVAAKHRFTSTHSLEARGKCVFLCLQSQTEKYRVSDCDCANWKKLSFH